MNNDRHQPSVQKSISETVHYLCLDNKNLERGKKKEFREGEFRY